MVDKELDTHYCEKCNVRLHVYGSMNQDRTPGLYVSCPKCSRTSWTELDGNHYPNTYQRIMAVNNFNKTGSTEPPKTKE